MTKRTTATAVSCSPGSVALNEGSSCTATVSDTDGGTKSFPSGSVSFGSDNPGTFAPGTSCTLAQVGATSTSSCSVTYTPTANAGTHKLSGAYSGSATHKISDGSFDLTVTKRTTATAVSCSPGSVALNEGSSCTATVSDTDGGTKSFPSGSVSFGSDNPGTFAPGTSCTLAQVGATSTSSCSVTYTPTANAGTHKLSGAYSGSATHKISDGSFDLTVTKRTTATAVSCSPGSVALNEGSSCTATVSDTDGGTKSFPSGSVSFGSDNPGTFTPGTSCTLAQVGATSTSSCSVTYTPTANAGTHKLSGAYSGSATHKISDGSFDLTVTKRTTATAVSCSPGSVVVSQNTTCSATVSDTNAGAKSPPSGNVTFSSSGVGTFTAGTGTFTAPSTCALAPAGPASSTCSVTYTPSSASSTTHTITGAYQGTALHKTSSGTFAVAVGKRSTTTSVGCNPLLTVISTSSTCTATVTDTEAAGTKSAPAGMVTFSFYNATTSSTTSSSCPLSPQTASSSSCSATYSSVVPAVVTVTGAYSGSDVHKPATRPRSPCTSSSTIRRADS